jgi:hypothetical protein
VTRGDLTDAEWELIEPHLPLEASGPIPDLRRYFNAVMWRFRTGSPWREVPESYRSWSTIFDRFRMRFSQRKSSPGVAEDEGGLGDSADPAGGEGVAFEDASAFFVFGCCVLCPGPHASQ